MEELEIKQLDYAGLKELMQWTEEEGWNPGPHDAEVFWATDPQGFMGIYKDEELIGGGSIVSYNGDFGFMGLFLVKPEYRSKGIGSSLWFKRRNTLLSRLKEGATIGMDGVVAMQPFYAKGGFTIAFRDERYSKAGEEHIVNEHITSIQEEDMDAVLAYDKQCFGFDRPQFMRPWLQMPGTKTFKYMVGDELKGFAAVRRLQKDYKVCPLFADDAMVAEELYKACLNSSTGAQLIMDIPVTNAQAVELVNKYNAEYIFECARMYYGTPPNLPIDKIFGITTFELG
ncbi:MAG: GNAT family N-acetyltransferase [Chitinophagaceae bacterium]|nr:GNAT family N-acetyltransferase [Chitinophagaceae bacterium]